MKFEMFIGKYTFHLYAKFYENISVRHKIINGQKLHVIKKENVASKLFTEAADLQLQFRITFCTIYDKLGIFQ